MNLTYCQIQPRLFMMHFFLPLCSTTPNREETFKQRTQMLKEKCGAGGEGTKGQQERGTQLLQNATEPPVSTQHHFLWSWSCQAMAQKNLGFGALHRQISRSDKYDKYVESILKQFKLEDIHPGNKYLIGESPCSWAKVLSVTAIFS